MCSVFLSRYLLRLSSVICCFSVPFTLCVCLSNALFSLLAECPALRTVKALGVTVTGKPIRGVALYRPIFLTPRAIREACEQRKVELVWTAPMPPEARDNYSNCNSSKGTGGDAIVGGMNRDEDENRYHQRKPLRELSSNGWKPCEFGCGASLVGNYVDDHLEVKGRRGWVSKLIHLTDERVGAKIYETAWL